MIALLLAAVLMIQDPTALSPEARSLIAPVAEAIAAEEARQAALPPPADVRERLERLGQLDQVGRRAAVRVDLSRLSESERAAALGAMRAGIAAMDERLLKELLPLVPESGWFTRAEYGEQASNAAFLIIQHSDVGQWRRFVPVLEPLALAGEIDGQDYGLMYDRLAISEGRLQRYGTQVTCTAGKYVIDWGNMEDPGNVDARRRAIGFPWTLAEYEQSFVDYPPCEGE